MKESTRAIRRHHIKRLKKARAGYWGREQDLSPRQLGMVVATPQCCACDGCGNPRRARSRWVGDNKNGLSFQDTKRLSYFHSSFADLLAVEEEPI